MSLKQGPSKDKDSDEPIKHTAIKVPRKPKKEGSSTNPSSTAEVDKLTQDLSNLKLDKKPQSQVDEVEIARQKLAAVSLSEPSTLPSSPSIASNQPTDRDKKKVKKEKVRIQEPSTANSSKDKEKASSAASIPAKDKQDDSSTEVDIADGHHKHTETKMRKPGEGKEPTLGELIEQYTQLKALIEKQQQEREGIHKQGEQIGRVDNNLDKTGSDLEEARQDLEATVSCGKAFKQGLKKFFCCCCATETPVPKHDIEFDVRHPKPITFQFAVQTPQSKGEYINEIERMAAYLDQESKKEGAELDDENTELKVVIDKSDKLKEKTKKTDSDAKTAIKL